MSTTEELKKYLIGEDGFLINPDNNGKTIMLSGTWGAGKTHFWQNEIEVSLSDKLKNSKACVYISLYGKDNIYDIKNEVFLKAYSQLEDNHKYQNIDTAISWLGVGSKIVSAVSFWGIKLDTTKVTDKVNDWNELDNLKKAQEAIENGGVICFDDFERKSKHIDLNDLFGTITQLSLDFNCKVVIILNSDVFENEEANIFKTVKEKTVNKFFYFEPSIEELFGSIYTSAKKYQRLEIYRDEILSVIKETEERNARIYIQVLDNCLEWIDKGYDSNVLRVLVLGLINFILNNLIFDYPVFKKVWNRTLGGKEITLYAEAMHSYPEKVFHLFIENEEFTEETFIQHIKKSIFNYEKVTDIEKSEIINWIKENKKNIMSVWKYGYKLNYCNNISEDEYMIVSNFIKTGILPKQGDTNILKKGNN